MSDELKPCPFCEGPARVVEGAAPYFDRRFQVECAHCRIATFFYDEAVARQMWNRRAPVAARPATGGDDKAIPADIRTFLENLAKAGSEPLNSVAAYRDKESRRHFMAEIRNSARALLANDAARQEKP